ncbi:MAG: hypothetical protein ACI9G1_000952 [Pirellulaceae bacterium]|jgi:hypothetical protein
MAGENLDLSSEPPRRPTDGSNRNSSSASIDGETRKFLGVQFACCGIYSRIYINPQRNAYAGNCPRCAKLVTVIIGAGGSDSRFFTAY